jgi:hypothetical protein
MSAAAGTWGARVIKVIETGLDLRGEGTSASPVRRVTQYWTLEGELLAEVDPSPEVDRLLADLAEAVYGTGAGWSSARSLIRAAIQKLPPPVQDMGRAAA